MIKYLKVKAKSLAEEAKIIQLEMKKAEKKHGRDSELFRGLQSHLIGVVRPEQRATFLAYAFLKGRKLTDVEMNPRDIPGYILIRALRMVKKYYPWKMESKYVQDRLVEEDFIDWLIIGSLNGNDEIPGYLTKSFMSKMNLVSVA